MCLRGSILSIINNIKGSVIGVASVSSIKILIHIKAFNNIDYINLNSILELTLVFVESEGTFEIDEPVRVSLLGCL